MWPSGGKGEGGEKSKTNVKSETTEVSRVKAEVIDWITFNYYFNIIQVML